MIWCILRPEDAQVLCAFSELPIATQFKIDHPELSDCRIVPVELDRPDLFEDEDFDLF